MNDSHSNSEAEFWRGYYACKAKEISEIIKPISAFLPGNTYIQKKREELKVLELA